MDDAAIKASRQGGTLVEMYSKLHPEQLGVPDDVAELSEQLEAAKAALPPSEVDPNATFEASDGLVDKSVNTFLATACVDDASTWGGYWDAYPSTGQCVYTTTINACTGNRFDPNDWSIGWNETSSNNVGHYFSASSFVFDMPPWTWSWSHWGGSYAGAKACLGYTSGYVVAGSTSPFGVTHHNWVPIVY